MDSFVRFISIPLRSDIVSLDGEDRAVKKESDEFPASFFSSIDSLKYFDSRYLPFEISCKADPTIETA